MPPLAHDLRRAVPSAGDTPPSDEENNGRKDEQHSAGSIIGCSIFRMVFGFHVVSSSRLPQLEWLRVCCAFRVCVHHVDLLYPVFTCANFECEECCRFACEVVEFGCTVTGRHLATGNDEESSFSFLDIFINVYNGRWAVSVFFVLSAFVASLPLQSFTNFDARAWRRLGRSLMLRFPRLAVPAMGANLFVVFLIQCDFWTSGQDPKWQNWWEDLTTFRKGPIALLGTWRLVGPGWCLNHFYRIPFLASLACATVHSANRHSFVVRLFLYGAFAWVATSAGSPLLGQEEVLCTTFGVVISDLYTSGRLRFNTRRDVIIHLAFIFVLLSLPLLPWLYNNDVAKQFAAGGIVIGVLWSAETGLAGKERLDRKEMSTSWLRRNMKTVHIKATKFVVALSQYTMTVYLWHIIVWQFCSLHIMPSFFGTPMRVLYFVVPWLILAAVTPLVYHFWEAPLIFLINSSYDRLMVVGSSRST